MTQEKSRIEDTRAAETRDANIRRNLRMEYSDSLYIDPQDVPPDVEYRWVRESVMGKPDMARMSVMKKKGWDPVPSSRHPERMIDVNATHLPSHLKGCIYHEGLVLCERLKVYCDIERDNVNKEIYRTMTATPGTDHLMSEPSMPMKVYFNENSILKTEKKGSFPNE